ncbi:hypothetical protein [Hymenobacter coccineus]|nr:hypothetical protein [Hymenobacter coccineus]
MSAATILNAFAVKWRYENDDAPDFAVTELLGMAHQFRDKLRPLAVAFLL